MTTPEQSLHIVHLLARWRYDTLWTLAMDDGIGDPEGVQAGSASNTSLWRAVPEAEIPAYYCYIVSASSSIIVRHDASHRRLGILEGSVFQSSAIQGLRKYIFALPDFQFDFSQVASARSHSA